MPTEWCAKKKKSRAGLVRDLCLKSFGLLHHSSTIFLHSALEKVKVTVKDMTRAGLQLLLSS